MHPLNRRTLLQGLSLAAAPALAQPSGLPPVNAFRYEEVVRRARELAGGAFDASPPALPEPLNRLDFDAYRDLRFRPDRALALGPFRLHLFHLGFLFQRPVTVNVIREGVPTPIPYQAGLFDYGRNRIERPLPVNIGFAGFRLHHPLNDPRILDELIAFLGASYFRVLGRDQRYGLSARGLTINVEVDAREEFPYFREFWIEVPPGAPDRAVVLALLDGASVTGAYRFEVFPSPETSVDVTATLFPRRSLPGVGLAPLTSMYFVGENDREQPDPFRPEVHDSDGLLMHTGGGEWIWRPLRNPTRKTVSAFVDNNPRGFGLMQRDRTFESYQDLEASYHLRPGYWVEPSGPWGEGRVKLVEIPTRDETQDNVVAYWEPRNTYEPGQEVSFGYRLRAVGSTGALHPGAQAVNTFQAPTRASGSSDPSDPTTRRFIVDFVGGDLPFYLPDPGQVHVVPTASAGRITHSHVVPNGHTRGFRAVFDVKLDPGQSADLRAYLRAGNRALTETWTYPWTAE